MSNITGFVAFVHRVYTALNPPIAEKSSHTIKFGILGAARIAPIALIVPAQNHPDVIVHAIAARDRTRAEQFAKKHRIEKAYGSYQELLEDKDVDAVYNPLPNGLHYEWTMRALAAGKHVLLEIPAANTAEETRKMFELADKKGLVLLEAFHYRFHPAVQRVKEILDSGELGTIKSIEAELAVPKGAMPQRDIRFNYELGRGAMMDMGCYTLNVIRYISSSNPDSVISATAAPLSNTAPNSLVDTRTTASLALPRNVTGSLMCDLAMAPRCLFVPRMPKLSLVVRCEGGDVRLSNFAVMPTFYHTIEVTPRGGTKRIEKAYTFKNGKGEGEAWWTTYRYQLSAFVQKVHGRDPQTWVSGEDSVANAHWIEEIYKATQLGSRKASSFVLQ